LDLSPPSFPDLYPHKAQSSLNEGHDDFITACFFQGNLLLLIKIDQKMELDAQIKTKRYGIKK
jgi:hypothetical protein